MKQRLGIVSTDKDIVTKIREGIPEIFAVHAKNIIEFFQYNGTQAVEGIVFHDEGNIAGEFKAIHNFIRSKKGFNQTPILILSESTNFKLNNLMLDPWVRFSNLNAGYFLPVLNFLSLGKNAQESMRVQLSTNQIIEKLETSLAEKLGHSTIFMGRPAGSEETHESFLSQMQDEISTNLLWVKLSLRILEKGSDNLKQMYQGMSESEFTEITEKILTMVFSEFKSEVVATLSDKQAVPIVDYYSLSSADRSVLSKQMQSEVYLFESNVCGVLLELYKMELNA